MSRNEIILWVIIDILLVCVLIYLLIRKKKSNKSNMTVREFYAGTGFNITKKHGALCCDDETKTWSIVNTKKKPQFYKYSDIKEFKMFSNTLNPEGPESMAENAPPPVLLHTFSSNFTSKMGYGDFSSYVTVYLHDGRTVNVPLIVSTTSNDRREINKAEVRLSKGTFELLKYMQENA